jgi:uncharacterized protein (TIRG00374 family)
MTRVGRGRLIKLAVTVGILALLASQLDLGQIWTLLSGVKLLPVVMAIGLLAASHMVVALIWRRLLAAVDVRLNVERTVSLYYAGLFLNNFFLGSVGGDSYRVYAAWKGSGGSGRPVLAATLLERLISVAALLLLGAIAVIVKFSTLPVTFRWLLLALSCGGTIAAFLIILVPAPLGRMALRLSRGRSEKTRERIAGTFEAMQQAGHPAAIFTMLLVALAAQGVRIWTHWWCARALGIEVAAADLFLVIPIIAVASGLPISIGGLGVREATGVLLLTPLGMAESSAFTMELLAWLVGVATSLAGGLIFLFGREVAPGEAESIESAV